MAALQLFQGMSILGLAINECATAYATGRKYI